MKKEFIDMLTVFQTHFSEDRFKKIAVYGVGNYAKVLERYCTDYHFCAFIDNNPEGKSVGTHKASSLDSITNENTDLIVTACAFPNERIIYERIRDYCEERKIPVYSIRGYLLNDYYDSKASQYRESREELLQEIESHDCISFDFFDTFFARRVLYPMDVFDLVARKAKDEGIAIEDFAAARIGAEYALDNPDFNQIYDRVQGVTGITESEKKRLMKLELETESGVLIPRKEIAELYCDALKNHPVAIVSDMYLPESFFKDVLKKHHLPLPDAIYISGWRGAKKTDTLFEAYKRDFQGKSYLHIGDNPSADGSMAFAAGIDPFLIRSGIQEYREAGFTSVLQACETINDRCLIGMAVSQAFNSPFVYADGKAELSSIEDIAGAFVAPLMGAFIIWMKDTVDTMDADALLFASRDGYLIKKLYEMYLSVTGKTEGKQLVYFYTSRLASVQVYLDDEDDIDFCIRNVGWFNEKKIGKLLGCTTRYELLCKAQGLKENYIHYLKKEKIYQKKCILLDLSSFGRTQFFLKKIITELRGVYFARQISNLPSYNEINAFYDSRKEEEEMFRGDFFLESILTSNEPSTIGFDSSGIPVFSGVERNEDEMDYINKTQENIFGFCVLFWRCFYDKNSRISKQVLSMNYHLFKENDNLIVKAPSIKEIEVRDDTTGMKKPI